MGRDLIIEGRRAALAEIPSWRRIVEDAKTLEGLRDSVRERQIAAAKAANGRVPAAVGLLGFRMFSMAQQANSLGDAVPRMLAELDRRRAGLEARKPVLR
jgi:hypothetical protein